MNTQERNRALARRWFEKGWGEGDTGIAEEVFSPDFTLRGRKVGPAGPVRSVEQRRAAFADMTVRIEQLIAEGPYVVTRFSTEARHVGTFNGIPPSGRTVNADGIVIWRIEDGKVVEDWNCFDTFRVLSAISPGGVPSPATPSEEQ